MGLYENASLATIEFRTKFKLLTIVFKTLQGNPSYLQRKLNSMTYHRTTRRLMTKGITLDVPFNKKKTQGDHGFSHTAAIHWNKLPEYIKQTRKLLKTHYFRLLTKPKYCKHNAHIFYT